MTKCPVCKEDCKVVLTHRRLTQYCPDTLNYITCCSGCKEADDEHWKEMWKEYYESQGFGAID